MECRGATVTRIKISRTGRSDRATGRRLPYSSAAAAGSIQAIRGTSCHRGRGTPPPPECPAAAPSHPNEPWHPLDPARPRLPDVSPDVHAYPIRAASRYAWCSTPAPEERTRHAPVNRYEMFTCRDSEARPSADSWRLFARRVRPRVIPLHVDVHRLPPTPSISLRRATGVRVRETRPVPVTRRPWALQL